MTIPAWPTKSKTRFADVSHGVRDDSIRRYQASSSTKNTGLLTVSKSAVATAITMVRDGSETQRRTLRETAKGRNGVALRMCDDIRPFQGAK